MQLKKKEFWIPIIVFLVTLVVWEVIVTMLQIPNYLLPSPSKIAVVLWQQKEVLWQHLLVTLQEAGIGLICASFIGIVTAIVMDLSKLIKISIYPHLVITQTVPIMVLAPLFSIWFGFGLTPKILIVVFMCFFPIVISFVNGMNQVSSKQIFLLKSYQAKLWQIYRYVKIPAAMPNLIAGLKVSATYCVSGAVVGEWISAQAGLGFYMLRSKNSYQLDQVFASVVLVILLSLCMHGVICLLEQSVCVHKRKEKRK